MPRTISPKMRKMIDLFLKEKSCDWQIAQKKEGKVWTWSWQTQVPHWTLFCSEDTCDRNLTARQNKKRLTIAQTMLRTKDECTLKGEYICTWQGHCWGCWRGRSRGNAHKWPCTSQAPRSDIFSISKDYKFHRRWEMQIPEGQKQVWEARAPGWWSSYSLVCSRERSRKPLENVSPTRVKMHEF